MTRKEAADIFRAVVIDKARPDVPADVREAMDVVLALIGTSAISIGTPEPREADK